MKSLKALFVMLLFTSQTVWSSIPKSIGSSKDKLKIIQAEGRQGLMRLRSVAFDHTQTVDARWKAFVTFAMVGGKDVLPEIEEAIQSTDWFMRDAGIKTLRKIDPVRAVKWSKHLVSDPSLVVRTSAVTTLHHLRDSSSKTLLWEKLDSPQNFRGKQSLWVRHHIVRVLAENAEKGEEQKFLKILTDADTRLHAPANLALTKLTGVKPPSTASSHSFWKSKLN